MVLKNIMDRQEVILKLRKKLTSCQTNQIAFVIFVWNSYIETHFSLLDSIFILESCLSCNIISYSILSEIIEKKKGCLRIE